MATKEVVKEMNQERVAVYLPMIEDDGSGKVDQNVEVIVNGKVNLIRRGEYVKVPFDVYEALRNSGRFQNI